ncbi:hypothetical protein H5410_026124 [Solanum commersonii]|uniref:Uncharacterized protein n=1 Tax=Solanum commersonii TaxID=4109 RepID=A0A9J5YXU4_SOLCO|nr:hypothetical protein H5410_026124 [Solanum commersonii]
MEYRLFVHTSEDQIDLWQPSRSSETFFTPHLSYGEDIEKDAKIEKAELHIFRGHLVLLRAFEGHEWEVKDSEFPELKYLELDDLNIAHSSVSEDA